MKSPDKPGLLIKINGYSLPVAVAMAKGQFRNADHCQGLTPAAIVFNPTEKPEADVVGGLAVLVAGDVTPGHLRIVAGEVRG